MNVHAMLKKAHRLELSVEACFSAGTWNASAVVMLPAQHRKLALANSTTSALHRVSWQKLSVSCTQQNCPLSVALPPFVNLT